MRILILSPFVPRDLYAGPSVRIYYILKELARRGHEIVLLAGHDGLDYPLANALCSACQAVITYPLPSSARRSSAVVAALSSLFSPLPYTAAKFGTDEAREAVRAVLAGRRLDLILANFDFMVNAIPPNLLNKIPVVLDEHESQGLLWRQYARHRNPAKRVFGTINLIKLERFEKRVFANSDAVLCNSEREAAFTRAYVHEAVEVWSVPNGVDTEYFAPSLKQDTKANRIIFCGALGVYRNRAAALWFARRIFPCVRHEIPDAEFWIVGSHPNDEIWALAESPGIHVSGTVEDTRPYYAKARVAVAPYHHGEGTKIKVLEALACGVPVVSTTVGCQGIDVVHGTDVLVADGEEEFSRRVIELVHDLPRAQALAAAGRLLVETKYTWNRIIGNLEPMLEDLVRRKRRWGPASSAPEDFQPSNESGESARA